MMWLVCPAYAISLLYFAARICVGEYVNIPCFVLYLVAAGVVVVDFLVEEIKAAWRDSK